MSKIKEQLEDWKTKVSTAYEQIERLTQETEEIDENLEGVGWNLHDEEEEAETLTDGKSDKDNRWTGPVGNIREGGVPEEMMDIN
eukprot:14795208-Heterocapsa_arctica.AAC.1